MNSTQLESSPPAEARPNTDCERHAQSAPVILRPGEFDPLAGEPPPQQQNGGTVSVTPQLSKSALKSDVPVLRVLTLDEVRNYEPPTGSLLVGDGVIELGEIALLFGPPGSYKGFAVGQLMASGARGYGEWLGHSVTTKFASLWVNCENGRRRLRDQFSKMNLPPDAEKFIHVTDIPAVWNLGDARLISEIRQIVVEKEIRLLVIDTVSNFTEDEFAKQFAAFFSALNTILAGIEIKPAVLLIHHSRKPKETDRGARGLLNLISGHQMLQRRARSICYLGRVTDEFDEKRVAAVWLKVSNNGQAEGTKTALSLAQDATLQPIRDFDWSQWENATGRGSGHEPKVNEGHLRQLFETGEPMTLKRAAEQLQEIAEVGRSAAYEALKLVDGRFSRLLQKKNGLIGLKPAVSNADNVEVDEPI